MHVGTMMIFNIIFNPKKPTLSKNYIISLVLNSLSCSFNYNYYKYDQLLAGKKVKAHQPSLLRQTLFTVILLTENLVLTTLTLQSPHGKIRDLSGESHDLPTGYIMVFIWGLQLVVFVLSAMYYGTHPASVPMKPSKEKAVLEIFGQRMILHDGDYCLKRGNHNYQL